MTVTVTALITRTVKLQVTGASVLRRLFLMIKNKGIQLNSQNNVVEK